MADPIPLPNDADYQGIMSMPAYALTDAFSEPCLLVNHKNGLILHANTAFNDLQLFPPAQITGQRLEDVVSPISSESSYPVWHTHQGEFRLKEVGLTLGEVICRQIILRKEEPLITPAVIDTARQMANVFLHRMRSPLTGTAGLVEMLELDLKDHESATLVSTIRDGLKQVNDLLEELDAFSSEHDPVASHVDIQYLINDLMSDLPPETRRRIQLAIQTDHLGLQTDYYLLRSMIGEMLDNAIEHSGAELDHITLSYTAKPRPLFRIRNFGKVIPAADVDRLPQPFFTTKARHLGLGLAKAYLIADHLRARIQLAENSQINGITFEVRF